MRYKHTYLTALMLALLCAEMTGCRAARRMEKDPTNSGRVPVLSVSQHSADANTDTASADDVASDAQADPTSPVSQQDWVISLNGQLVSGDDESVTIDLTETPVSDSDLAKLSTTPSVSQLNLSRTTISNQGLTHLPQHTELKVLRLDSTQVTDAGVAEISKCQKLELLGLTKTGVTDAGLQHLVKNSDLRFLLLDYTAVTDRGIASLKSMKNLEGLSLMHTAVTARAVERLQFELPACSIIYKENPDSSDSASAQFQRSINPQHEFAPNQRMTVGASPNWLPQTESISLQPLTKAEDDYAPLPIIRPKGSARSKVVETRQPQQATRANQNGWLGAQQSASPAQSVARVGFTTPRR